MAPERIAHSIFVEIAEGEVVTGINAKGQEASIYGPVRARAFDDEEVVTLQTFGGPEIKIQIPRSVYESWPVRGQR